MKQPVQFQLEQDENLAMVTPDNEPQAEQPVRRSGRASKRRKLGFDAKQDPVATEAAHSHMAAASTLTTASDSGLLEAKANSGTEARRPGEEAAVTQISPKSTTPTGAEPPDQTHAQAEAREDNPGTVVVQYKDDLSADAPMPQKAKTIASHNENVPVRRKGRSKWDDPIEMLTNQKSPLGTAMLRDLLCTDRAWDILTEDEKKQVLKEFPQGADILEPGTEKARPNIASLRNNNNFRHDISRYQEDLREGRHDPEWISQAQAAHRKRELGVFDAFLAKKFEEDWGIPMPSLGGDASLDTPPAASLLSTTSKVVPEEVSDPPRSSHDVRDDHTNHTLARKEEDGECHLGAQSVASGGEACHDFPHDHTVAAPEQRETGCSDPAKAAFTKAGSTKNTEMRTSYA
ncbi:Asx homology domain-domain-containing protein [Microdochium bolleyi]|uniref:Asx homology domain-domain-containing protein n=1 Tax=Microdochium bolleyi TaxID=196109 RepID=A0A136J7S7_9PEZI|nr:Asx homology domain-domain-containing protein [Microdochium bolleyi]